MTGARLARLIAVPMALALVATACGDDDDDSSTATTQSDETTTTAPKLAGEPILLMAVFEKSAGVANPELAEGAIAAAEAINRAGGIQGRPVEIIECDTTNDPNTAAECGRRAVEDGVVAMVGNLTVHAGEFMPLLEENAIASIGLTPAGAADFTSAASFPIAGGAPVIFAALAAATADDGATKIATGRIDIAAGAALPAFVGAGLARFDLQVHKDVPVPVGAPDMSSYAAAALADGTDAVVVGLPGQDSINFIQAVRQADPDVRIAMTATEIGSVIEALGDGAEGIFQATSLIGAIDDAPAVVQFHEDLEAAGFDEDTGFRLNSYASVMVFAEVAMDLPEITAAAVFEAMNTAQGIDVGLTAPLSFQEGVGGLPRVFNPCVLTTRLADGEPVPVTGTMIDAYTGEECPTPG